MKVGSKLVVRLSSKVPGLIKEPPWILPSLLLVLSKEDLGLQAGGNQAGQEVRWGLGTELGNSEG